MKHIAGVALLAAFFVAGHGIAQQSPAATAPKGAEPNITLKDGSVLAFRKDGTMSHGTATGKRIRMKDGVVMETANGERYMMKNNAVWKALTEKGTLNPNR